MIFLFTDSTSMASTVQSDISSPTDDVQPQSLNVDSDFDDGLAVPSSLSVIPGAKKENLEIEPSVMENQSEFKIFFHYIFNILLFNNISSITKCV